MKKQGDREKQLQHKPITRRAFVSIGYIEQQELRLRLRADLGKLGLSVELVRRSMTLLHHLLSNFEHFRAYGQLLVRLMLFKPLVSQI